MMTTQSRMPRHRKQHISQRANSIQPSGIRKFFDLLSSIDGVISLGVGEPDFTTPWHIRESAIESIEQGQTMYTSNSGMPELRKELARYLKNEYGVDYDPTTEILITVGCSEALDLTMRAIVDPGDEVIIPDPCFVAYGSCVTLAGGKPVHIPTYEMNNFEITAKDIEEKITGKTRAILIGYPSNPTGAVMSRQKLADIAALALKYDLTVISDEIYSKLIYGAEFTCFASLPEMKEHTVFLGGFSKAFALEALKGEQDSVTEMVEDYSRRRMVMVKGFRDIGLDCYEPRGAFYAFPSIRCTGMTSEEFAEKLLTEEKVAVVPGSAFGKCGEGYIRCCYATSLTDIEEALKRMGRFVKKYKK
jgi:aminotransferase